MWNREAHSRARVGRETGQCQCRAGVVRPHIRRQVKYASYRQPDRSLFLGGQCLPQRRSGKSSRLLEQPGCEERYRARRDKGTAECVPRRRQFERSPGELGGSGRVARTKIAGRFEQGGDGGFVARLGAVGELLSHLDRYRAFGHEHVGRLAVKRPANRDGGTGPHRLADQVVSERKAIAALHEDASLDKIFDWFQQLRYRHPGQLSQLVYGEQPAQRRRERRHPVCRRGHPQQADAHVVTDALRHAVF